MKGRNVAFIIILIVLFDQALKIYIKTNFLLEDSRPIFGEWAYLNFVENPGAAWGAKIAGSAGKLSLTLFRMIAVIFGTWYLVNIIKKKYHKGFIICAAMIYAGALGNLIDSSFYGMIFDKGMIPDPSDPSGHEYLGYSGLAEFSKHGYASFLHGNVVDMFYFPMLKGTFPSWFPFWGDQKFVFFSPVFNIADAAISSGVITVLIFQKRFFKHQDDNKQHPTVETGALSNDDVQVQ
ncbi:lipoprotein signal peptidase [Ferruginibacter sp. SUN002]|uniref:lipoprotein signal peptidase n=1 Tax=Ferruginibacter sp. SUN002 TaxID=2937789 RepID=UPI003D35A4A9